MRYLFGIKSFTYNKKKVNLATDVWNYVCTTIVLYDVNLIHVVYTIAKYCEYFYEGWLYLLLELVSAEFRWTYFVNSILALEHIRSHIVIHFHYHYEISFMISTAVLWGAKLLHEIICNDMFFLGRLKRIISIYLSIYLSIYIYLSLNLLYRKLQQCMATVWRFLI